MNYSKVFLYQFGILINKAHLRILLKLSLKLQLDNNNLKYNSSNKHNSMKLAKFHKNNNNCFSILYKIPQEPLKILLVLVK